jgi:hypothetical protein
MADMKNSYRARASKRLVACATILCAALAMLGSGIVTSALAQEGLSKSAGGVTVYLGIVPAGIVKGPPPHSTERPMHGRVPRGSHEYHVVAAVFDGASGARVTDAAVTAQVSGVGLSGAAKKLEPMQIASTTTYGAFFTLPGHDLYTVRVSVQRADASRPVRLDFKYDHRRS